MDSPPLIIAHRGDSAHAPENTLAAYRLAREAGADWIELDIQCTHDGRLICLHDESLERTSDIRARYPFLTNYSPWQLRYEQIEELDAGSWFDPEFSDEKIPTLREALHVAQIGRSLGVMVEIKGECLNFGEQSIATILNAEIATAGLPKPTSEYGGIIVTSFYPQPLQELAQIAPEVALFQLVPPIETIVPSLYPNIASALDYITAYARGVSIPLKEATPEHVRTVRERGLAVFVWTVNEPDSIANLAALGVEGIITDDPGSTRATLTTHR
jgi:glycerophosphoryl diester phosphodiesterase